uniref:Oxidoreductase n=1 Tax=Streptomyces sp. NBC_00093 TaxID=2975649 RepID=A0AAU2A448_9ACTN
MTGCGLPGLVADAAQIDARLALSRCRLTGPLVLTRAQLNGDLDLRDTTVTAPGGEAVSAVHATVGGDALCTNLTVDGGFRLSGASMDGEFDLEGAALRNPGGHALDAYHVRITEDFTFHPGFSAEGRITVSGATVGAGLGFCGARLSNAGDIALEAIDVTVNRNIDLGGGLTAEGGMKLDGTPHSPTPRAPPCPCARTQARETDLGTRLPIDGTVDARKCPPGHAVRRPGHLAGRPPPGRDDVRRPREPLPAAERVRWIRRTGGGYLPQPYEQLATAYRKPGHEDEARTVLLARQRHRRTTLAPHVRVWGTSRTRPSATATAPSTQASGCWPSSSVARCTPARIPRPRSKRARHRGSTPSSAPSTCWSRSSPSAGRPPSHPGTPANGWPTR